MTGDSAEPGIDLYWLPLGAGGRSVRLNGRVFEAVAARVERRRACDLYHSALEVRVPEGRFVIEMTPILDGNGVERGVVAEGAVGTRWAGRFRIFRSEVRRWRHGVIPDVAEAVESPRRPTNDPGLARRALELGSRRAHGRLGSRRARGRRDVEFQLVDCVADRALWALRGVRSPVCTRAGPWLASGTRRGAPTARCHRSWWTACRGGALRALGVAVEKFRDGERGAQSPKL